MPSHSPNQAGNHRVHPAPQDPDTRLILRTPAKGGRGSGISIQPGGSLFEQAEGASNRDSIFRRVLDAYFDGQADAATLARL